MVRSGGGEGDRKANGIKSLGGRAALGMARGFPSLPVYAGWSPRCGGWEVRSAPVRSVVVILPGAWCGRPRQREGGTNVADGDAPTRCGGAERSKTSGRDQARNGGSPRFRASDRTAEKRGRCGQCCQFKDEELRIEPQWERSGHGGTGIFKNLPQMNRIYVDKEG